MRFNLVDFLLTMYDLVYFDCYFDLVFLGLFFLFLHD